CGLADLAHLGLSACTALKWLDVSFNRLSSLDGLQRCAALTHIDASHNHIVSLVAADGAAAGARARRGSAAWKPGGAGALASPPSAAQLHVDGAAAAVAAAPKTSVLFGCRLLLQLNVAANQVMSVADVLATYAACPLLRAVDVRGNPVADTIP